MKLSFVAVAALATIAVVSAQSTYQAAQVKATDLHNNQPNYNDQYQNQKMDRKHQTEEQKEKINYEDQFSDPPPSCISENQYCDFAGTGTNTCCLGSSCRLIIEKAAYICKAN
jgi:hypothetical protein